VIDPRLHLVGVGEMACLSDGEANPGSAVRAGVPAVRIDATPTPRRAAAPPRLRASVFIP
jgi:hypothetical protein